MAATPWPWLWLLVVVSRYTGPRHDRRSAVEGGRGHHHRGAVPRAPPAAQQGGLHAAVRRDLGAVRHASHRGVPTDTRPGETTAGEQ